MELTTTELAVLERLGAREGWLAVLATSRPDTSIQASVVNAGLISHPISGERVVAIVARGGTVKLRNLRQRPTASVVFRSGGEWAAIEGQVELIGPDDPLDGFAASDLTELLREVFRAAGGTHDDWPTYDRVMAEERRAVILIHPERSYGNHRG
ncbi:MAG: TIGR03618 family F420-dependent PPOX class oxidoreductase [Chloroflexi bacterium]|nr:TIGR03618 family F420-dependent PPOX class oxidoreductase [Chloroflexota bacterium]MBV9597112.1 TIGR03618 family F420-dependent PPOX class oxidoreductase [Chloroflexota bacterium]